jgi:endonuclease-3
VLPVAAPVCEVPAVTAREKARRIGRVLDALYPAPPIPLAHRDPYTLLVAVMLSAQTTDKKVNEVTPALFALADTPAKMARTPVEAILQRIRTVGLAPTKARNLQALSKLLVERHGGIVPSDEPALEALPGVGHKTASVVRVQAFGLPAFPVDTHIHRNVVETERDLKALFPESEWARRHLQIIYFGREHCPALRHDPAACAICAWAAPAPGRARTRKARVSARRGGR